MNHAKVIVLSILAACIYGILHDQVTVRLCTEYFTVAHPPLFHTSSLTLLAICWGIAATFGVGLMLGVVLALVSQSGSAPPTPIKSLAQHIALLLLVMAGAAFVSAVIGYQLSARSWIMLPGELALVIPPQLHHRFMAAWFAHGASYLFGLVGGGMLCFRIWKERGRPRVLAVIPRSRVSVLRMFAVLVIAAVILWIRFRAD